jgi:hypothetical protein
MFLVNQIRLMHWNADGTERIKSTELKLKFARRIEYQTTKKEKQKAHIFAVARHLRLIAISDSLNPERKTLAC